MEVKAWRVGWGRELGECRADEVRKWTLKEVLGEEEVGEPRYLVMEMVVQCVMNLDIS